MTSSIKLFLLISALPLLAACTPAKSPLAASSADATFAIYPDRVKAPAELLAANQNSFGKARLQTLHFEVCLQNQISGIAIVPGTKFAIGDGGHDKNSELTREVDVSGCLHWDETHEFSPVAAQRSVQVRRLIRGLGNHRGTVTLLFNVKPWLEGAAAVQPELNQEVFAQALGTPQTFGFKDAYPVAVDGVPTQISLANNEILLRFEKYGADADYRVDEYLNISIPYRYTLTFHPKITQQMFSGGPEAKPMTTGRLRATLVFFASGKGEAKFDDHYLTSTQVEGDVSADGTFSAPVVVRYPHPLFAAGRVTLLMQISPVDQTYGVKAQSYSGSLDYVDQQAPTTLLAETRDAEAVHAQNLAARAKVTSERPHPLVAFISDHGAVSTTLEDYFPPQKKLRDDTLNPLLPITVVAGERDWHSYALSREELSQALDQDTFDGNDFNRERRAMVLPLASRLCQAFMALNADFGLTGPAPAGKTYLSVTRDINRDLQINNYCLPGSVAQNLDFKRLDFVEQLGSDTPRNVQPTEFKNLRVGTFTSHQSTSTTTMGVVFAMPALPTPLSFLPLAVPASGHTHSWATINGGDFAYDSNLSVDINSLEINARVRRCLLVTGLAAPFVARPWLICAKQMRPLAWIAEQYYYYAQIFGNAHSPVHDVNTLQSGVKFFVRGSVRMSSISDRLKGTDFQEKGLNVFIEAHVPDLSRSETLQPLDFLTDQDAPGAFRRK